MSKLNWPIERAHASLEPQQQWSHSGSNLCLDFHGDPIRAKLVVYSDGNHHMALQQSVQTFLELHPELDDIFYATTPPGVLVEALQNNGLVLGNLTLSAMPNVFIGPELILKNLVDQKYCHQYTKFIKSQGNVLLVLKDNPLNITSVDDLFRDDVCLFISNPDTEKASYQVYHEFLLNTGLSQQKFNAIKTFYGSKIHHREAPQALFDGKATAAVVYYHLALRYCRVFPNLFEIVELLPLRDSLNPITEYAVGVIADGAKYGQQFYEFMLGDTVRDVYLQHGLQIL